MIRLAIAIIVAILLGLLAATTSPAQAPPEDGDRYSIVIVDDSPPTAAGQRLAAMLDSPPLREIADACHRHVFTPTSPLYRERYAEAIPPTALPVFAVTRPDGGVIYKASGPSIPSADDLAKALTHRAREDQAAGSPDINGPSRPYLRPLDRVIPDSINLQPTIAIDGAIPAVILIVLGLAALGLFGVLAAAAVGVFLYLRR